MTGECFCRPKEKFRCFYITKDNVEEFVNEYGYRGEHTVTITEGFAYVKYKSMTWCIRLNAFVVDEYDGWISVTQKQFNENYEIEM